MDREDPGEIPEDLPGRAAGQHLQGGIHGHLLVRESDGRVGDGDGDGDEGDVDMRMRMGMGMERGESLRQGGILDAAHMREERE